MKPLITIVSSLLLAIPQVSLAQTLNLGSGNTHGSTTAIFGQSNSLRFYSYFGMYFHSNRSLGVGLSNSAGMEDSLVVGRYNTLPYDSEEFNTISQSSGVVGSWNYMTANNSLAVGTGNTLALQFTGGGGSFDWEKPNNAVVMGSGLINRFNNCTIVGKNNVSSSPTAPHTGPAPLFIIANGASSSNRSNALVVLDNGDVIITKPQGDISMGDYE